MISLSDLMNVALARMDVLAAVAIVVLAVSAGYAVGRHHEGRVCQDVYRVGFRDGARWEWGRSVRDTVAARRAKTANIGPHHVETEPARRCPSPRPRPALEVGHTQVGRHLDTTGEDTVPLGDQVSRMMAPPAQQVLVPPGASPE